MKKAHAVTTALCFLLFAVAVSSLALQVNYVVANPFMHLPMDPHTIVTVLPPLATSTFKTENVILRVNLNLSQWYMTYKGTTTLMGHISSLYYELDGQSMMYSGTLPPASGFSTCSVPLNGLSEGRHSLKVYAKTSGYYSRSCDADGGIHGFTNVNGQVEDSSDPLYFAVYTLSTPTPTQSPIPTTVPSSTPSQSPSPTASPTPSPTSTPSPSVPEVSQYALIALLLVATTAFISYKKSSSAIGVH